MILLAVATSIDAFAVGLSSKLVLKRSFGWTTASIGLGDFCTFMCGTVLLVTYWESTLPADADRWGRCAAVYCRECRNRAPLSPIQSFVDPSAYLWLLVLGACFA